ncbi:hypothetical protein ACH4VX_09470 [Streptomyces sp. NPDC020731]|uniref:hypothetical protein n=1 Tax=Streptomyces sp. NPDC020731 TaxID=3365085 RepID=UPI0037995B42
MVLGAPVAGAVPRRYSPRRTATLGTVLVVLGIAGLSQLGAVGTWAVTGAGFATDMVTATVVGEAQTGHAGASVDSSRPP